MHGGPMTDQQPAPTANEMSSTQSTTKGTERGPCQCPGAPDCRKKHEHPPGECTLLQKGTSCYLIKDDEKLYLCGSCLYVSENMNRRERDAIKRETKSRTGGDEATEASDTQYLFQNQDGDRQDVSAEWQVILYECSTPRVKGFTEAKILQVYCYVCCYLSECQGRKYYVFFRNLKNYMKNKVQDIGDKLLQYYVDDERSRDFEGREPASPDKSEEEPDRDMEDTRSDILSISPPPVAEAKPQRTLRSPRSKVVQASQDSPEPSEVIPAAESKKKQKTPETPETPEKFLATEKQKTKKRSETTQAGPKTKKSKPATKENAEAFESYNTLQTAVAKRSQEQGISVTEANKQVEEEYFGDDQEEHVNEALRYWVDFSFFDVVPNAGAGYCLQYSVLDNLRKIVANVNFKQIGYRTTSIDLRTPAWKNAIKNKDHRFLSKQMIAHVTTAFVNRNPKFKQALPDVMKETSNSTSAVRVSLEKVKQAYNGGFGINYTADSILIADMFEVDVYIFRAGTDFRLLDLTYRPKSILPPLPEVPTADNLLTLEMWLKKPTSFIIHFNGQHYEALIPQE